MVLSRTPEMNDHSPRTDLEPGAQMLRRSLGRLVGLHEKKINPSQFRGHLFAHHSIPAFDNGRTPVVEYGSTIKSTKFTVPSDAVLVSRLNPRFPRVWMPAATDDPQAICSTEFAVLRPRSVGRRYLHYLCLAPTFRTSMRARVTGTSGSHQRVTPSDLLGIRVNVPDIGTQRAIAHVLRTLDDRIALNRRMSATLDAMARALFKSWFVDFDPVCAKMQGRETGLPHDIADLFPDRLVDSELGEIPAGWTAGTLGDLAILNPESWTARNPPPCVEYVDLSRVKWGAIGEVRTFAWIDAPSRARRVLRSGDTIVGTVRPRNGSWALIGRSGLTGSTGFAVLRPVKSCVRELVWCAATSPDAIDRLGNLADGGAYPAVRPGVVLDTVVMLPGAALQNAFSSLARPVLEQMLESHRREHTLMELRDTLLPRLVSGDLRVPGAARTVEDAP